MNNTSDDFSTKANWFLIGLIVSYVIYTILEVLLPQPCLF